MQWFYNGMCLDFDWNEILFWSLDVVELVAKVYGFLCFDFGFRCKSAKRPFQRESDVFVKYFNEPCFDVVKRLKDSGDFLAILSHLKYPSIYNKILFFFLWLYGNTGFWSVKNAHKIDTMIISSYTLWPLKIWAWCKSFLFWYLYIYRRLYSNFVNS